MAGNNMAAQNELDIPRTQPDTRSGILTLVPPIAERESEKPTPSLGEIGSREFFYALEAHHLSPYVMAVDIAIAAKDPAPFGFTPELAGRSFLADPALVREVAETNTKITSQIPGKNEKPIRERAGEVFAMAQVLVVLEKEQLESIRSMYSTEPDSTGFMFNESAARKRAQAMLDLKAAGEAGLTRTEDKEDLDLARGLDGRLLKKDLLSSEPSNSVEPVDVYITSLRELARV
jgi:hypothetical protein